MDMFVHSIILFCSSALSLMIAYAVTAILTQSDTPRIRHQIKTSIFVDFMTRGTRLKDKPENVGGVKHDRREKKKYMAKKTADLRNFV